MISLHPEQAKLPNVSLCRSKIIDDKVYIGSPNIVEEPEGERQLHLIYQHIRHIGIECFKIVCIKEYTDITKTKQPLEFSKRYHRTIQIFKMMTRRF